MPEVVLAAFGLKGRPEALPGGTGHSVRVGEVVLKAAWDEPEATWLAQLQHELRPADVRTPQFRRATDGRWVVDGWTAATYLPGAGQPGRWEAGQRPHHLRGQLVHCDLSGNVLSTTPNRRPSLTTTLPNSYGGLPSSGSATFERLADLLAAR